MPLSVKHAFQSGLADSGDAALVQPSNWNDEHDMTTDTGTLLGDADGKGNVGAITVGTGLQLTGGELSSTVTAPNTFGTIVVSGQDDVVADSSTDKLTLVAGTNITITTDKATDSITITASGGSASAGGNDGTVQYNSSSALAGDDAFGYAAAIKQLYLDDPTADSGNGASIYTNQLQISNDNLLTAITLSGAMAVTGDSETVTLGTNAPSGIAATPTLWLAIKLAGGTVLIPTFNYTAP